MERQRVMFFGTGEIGLPSLDFLATDPAVELCGVVSSVDRPAGRGHTLRPGPVAQYALDHSLPLWQPEKLRAEELREIWSALEPDLLIVMAYGKILPRWLLELPRIAPWNLHASLLPKHRGASPIQAAILAGESVTGITVMQMDAGLDTGDILLQLEVPIGPEETAGELHDKLSALAPQALAEALRKLRRGELIPLPQDDQKATYCGKITKEDGRVRWDLSAAELCRRIRAFFPWPGSYSELERPPSEKLLIKIGRAEEVGAPDLPGWILSEAPTTGSLFILDSARMLVATGQGFLEILELQRPGGRMLKAGEFLRGYPLPRAGARFVT